MTEQRSASWMSSSLCRKAMMYSRALWSRKRVLEPLGSSFFFVFIRSCSTLEERLLELCFLIVYHLILDHSFDVLVVLLLLSSKILFKLDNLGPNIATHPAKDCSQQIEELVYFSVAFHIASQAET